MIFLFTMKFLGILLILTIIIIVYFVGVQSFRNKFNNKNKVVFQRQVNKRFHDGKDVKLLILMRKFSHQATFLKQDYFAFVDI